MPPQTNPLRQQLKRALTALRQTAGVEGRVAEMAPRKQHGHDHRPDAVLELAVQRRAHRFAVEAKAAVDRVEALWVVKDRLDRFDHPGLLFAPYITHAIGHKCRELDLPFLDAEGNAYLRFPGLYVFITGQRPTGGAQAALNVRGLGTATALRMVFGLLCLPELLNATYRDIADATGIALGAVGQVFRDLRKRGYLGGGHGKGKRRLVEPVRLFEEWVTNYPIKLRPKLNPRHFRAQDPHWWKNADLARLHAQWGGEVAAHYLTKHLKPGAITLYVPPGREPDPVTRLVAQHKLHADLQGDVEILEKFWAFPADPETPDIVPPILVYADLAVTLDPRNLETAQLIRKRYIDHALHTA